MMKAEFSGALFLDLTADRPQRSRKVIEAKPENPSTATATYPPNTHEKRRTNMTTITLPDTFGYVILSCVIAPRPRDDRFADKFYSSY
jgi:hypothetical protein